MSRQCGEESGYTVRTLQRDFGTIKTLFGIEIRHNGNGYGIVQNNILANFHEELLCNFEILNAIDSDSTIQQYILISLPIIAIMHKAPILPTYSMPYATG